MIRVFSVIICLFIFSLLALAQDSSVVDDSLQLSQDTVFEAATITEYVYIDGPPNTYFATGFSVQSSYIFANPSSLENRKGKQYSIGIAGTYVAGKFMYNSSVQFSQLEEKIENTQEFYESFYRQEYKYDTLSSYIQRKGDIFEIRYVVDSTLIDVLDSTKESATGFYDNAFEFIMLPLSVGYELKYGFFCIYANLGIAPGMIWKENDRSMVSTKENNIVYSGNAYQKFFCDADVGLTCTYLVTPKCMLALDAGYAYSLTSRTKKDIYNPLKYGRVSLGLKIYYIFSKY